MSFIVHAEIAVASQAAKNENRTVEDDAKIVQIDKARETASTLRPWQAGVWMIWMGWFAIAAGYVPLLAAWRANRRTSLRDAVLWASAAWLSWGFAITQPTNDDLSYVALCFTGCAGVAVLGARRPHVGAWNFVVLGLLGVMVLPLLEGFVIRVDSFNIERKIFLSGILIVAIVNYLATRFYLAASALGIGCAIAYGRMVFPSWMADWREGVAIAAVPWLAWWAARKYVHDAFDAEWFDFRDRFGLVWGMRVREQFNAAAKNGNLPMQLNWKGRDPAEGEIGVDEAHDILKALTKRFGDSAVE